MKKFLLLLLLAFSGFAQAGPLTTVTGVLQYPNGSAVSKGVYVQFDLVNCGQNQPKVSGVANVTTSFRVSAVRGAVSTALYGNDQISCGGVADATRWQWQFYVNNQPVGSACQQHITGASWDLNSNLCDSAAPPPAAVPSYDDSHLPPDGGKRMAGPIIPAADATYSLGARAARWNAYLSSLNGMATDGGSTAIGQTSGLHLNGCTALGPGHVCSQLMMLDSLANPPQSTLSIYGIHQVAGRIPAGEAQDGISGEVSTYGAVKVGSGAVLNAGEFAASVGSTGGTLAAVSGIVTGGQTHVGSTTNVTNFYSLRAGHIAKSGTGTIANAYGVYLDGQDAGKNSWSLASEGNILLFNDTASIYARDARGTARNILWPNGNNAVEFKPLNDANGWQFLSMDRRTNYLLINRTAMASGVAFSAPSVAINGGTAITGQSGSGATVAMTGSPTFATQISTPRSSASPIRLQSHT